MGNNSTPPDMSEEQLLAPWHVTGKLGESEARKVEELARQDREFARLLEDAKREAEADVQLNEALGAPPQAVWERLQRSIDQEQGARSRDRHLSFITAARAKLSGLFDGAAWLRWQAVAAFALALCVLQAGALVYLTLWREPSKYAVASGPKAEGTRPAAFIVRFSDTATIEDVNKALDGAGAIIVDGPDSGMLYHLGLRSDNVETRRQAYGSLRSSAVVKLILPEK